MAVFARSSAIFALFSTVFLHFSAISAERTVSDTFFSVGSDHKCVFFSVFFFFFFFFFFDFFVVSRFFFRATSPLVYRLYLSRFAFFFHFSFVYDGQKVIFFCCVSLFCCFRVFFSKCISDFMKHLAFRVSFVIISKYAFLFGRVVIYKTY
jgi:hypothetical protein